MLFSANLALQHVAPTASMHDSVYLYSFKFSVHLQFELSASFVVVSLCGSCL